MMLSPDLLAITFGYDRDGNISRLSAPLEPLVADIVFGRIAGGDVLDPAFRESCARTYQNGPIKHVVRWTPTGGSRCRRRASLPIFLSRTRTAPSRSRNWRVSAWSSSVTRQVS